MSYQQIENKARQDAAKMNTGSSYIVGDASSGFGRFEKDIRRHSRKAKNEFSSWFTDESHQISQGFSKMNEEIKGTAFNIVDTVRKNAGHMLEQYNSKVQQAVDEIPGGFAEKIAKYPWVAISAALVAGFMLGGLLKPAQR